MKAINVEALSKTFFGGTVAVDGIRFSLNQGEIFGFLGPNGAGKTTTVKLLCGMLTPSGGKCQVLGIDPVQNPEQLHQKVGVVTEHAQMYDHMTAWDNLQFYGTLFGMSRSECADREKQLLHRLELADVMDRKLATYSTGMRQRLSLARALLHRPQILFLDEPTSGLDPESAQNVNSLIQEQAAEGITVFLCTHQLRYAQEICTTYGLMDKGHLFATGNITELRAMVSRNRRVRVKASCLPKGMVYKEVGDHIYDMNVTSEHDIPLIVKRIVEAGGDLYHVSEQQMSLEEIYFSLIDPIMASSVMAASSFVGEKEKHTLETLLYSPLSLRQLFQSKILAGLSVGIMVSYISFAAMLLVVEMEVFFLTGNLIIPSMSWLIIMLLIAPSFSLVAIAVTVRSSAKAKTIEEAQQRAVFLIFPILALVIGQFTGILLINSWLLLGLGTVLVVLDVLLMRGAAGNFTYEKLLK